MCEIVKYVNVILNNMKNVEKVVLAYSGGLDTSVAIKLIQERLKAEVVAVTVDLGQNEDLDAIKKKAEALGVKSYVIDAREEFVNDYIAPSIRANGMYERVYPLATALARPLIAKYIVDIAHREGADAVSHGCTAKGNDQVRFDVTYMTLGPELEIVATQRLWQMSRDVAIDYAKEHGISVPVTKEKPYSIDFNLWGRSIEGGILEDLMVEPPEDIYEMTRSVADAPSEAEYVDVEFENGLPVALNGERKPLIDIIETMNRIAGTHGVGRIDHIEDRVVGIKSREIYEAPAAISLIEAHRAIESMTLTKDVIFSKYQSEDRFADLTYIGLWFTRVMRSTMASIDATQDGVDGLIRLKFHKGSVRVVGRKSERALYSRDVVTYEGADKFRHDYAEGYISLLALPHFMDSVVNKRE